MRNYKSWTHPFVIVLFKEFNKLELDQKRRFNIIIFDFNICGISVLLVPSVSSSSDECEEQD